jgi:hypothetical protein
LLLRKRPTAAYGTQYRTFSDDALGNAAADRLARLQEQETAEVEG